MRKAGHGWLAEFDSFWSRKQKPLLAVAQAAPAGYPAQSLHDIRLVIGTPGRHHQAFPAAEGKLKTG
jgi:hypothetical protein